MSTSQTKQLLDTGHAYANLLFAIKADDLTSPVAHNLNAIVCQINDLFDQNIATPTSKKRPVNQLIPDDPAEIQLAAIAMGKTYIELLKQTKATPNDDALADQVEVIQYRLGAAMRQAFAISTKDN